MPDEKTPTQMVPVDLTSGATTPPTKADGFLKAASWTGSGWLITLCILLLIVGGTYIIAHCMSKNGKEYVQLDKTQLKVIKKILDDNPTNPKGDDQGTKPVTDPKDTANGNDPKQPEPEKNNVVFKTRAVRTGFIAQYLQDEYVFPPLKGASANAPSELTNLIAILEKMSDTVVYDYLSDKKILVASPFWLTGGDVYIESFWWSLLGVLVSLIFYVSTANSNSLTPRKDENNDIGIFDPAAIPNQVAKMFYAPAVTIVLVLAYHFLKDSNNNMVDISVNKGLIVFSFIAGFYSGRLMKFLDKLKELLLPISSAASPSAPSAPVGKPQKDVVIKPGLSATILADANVATIKGDLINAKVMLTPVGGGSPIVANASKDAQNNDVYSAKQVPLGKYHLQASMTAKTSNGDNIVGNMQIEVTESKTSFELVMDKG